MLEFVNAANGTKIRIDPLHVVAVQETTRGTPPQPAATITLSNGHLFTVEDPGRTVAQRIEQGKLPRPAAAPPYLTKALYPETQE